METDEAHMKNQWRTETIKAGMSMNSKNLAIQAVKLMDAKKAVDVNLIDIREVSTLGEYFVIATGTSSTHVKALADELEMRLKEEGASPDHIEGYRSNSWILLDYGEVIIHVFTRESREFYDLDRLWQDGVKVDISEYLIREE